MKTTEDESRISAATESRLLASMALLHQEFHRNPPLQEIARAANLSDFYFHRQFRRHFGKTPKQVIAELQVKEAQRLMLAGMPLRDVAKLAGFSHQAHFTARFKQCTGLTPSNWRQTRA